MTEHEWTVIARSEKPGRWQWSQGWAPGMAQSYAAEDRIVMMHRKAPTGWDLVARLAGQRGGNSNGGGWGCGDA